MSACALSAQGSDWQKCWLPDLRLEVADLSDSSWADVAATSANLNGTVLDGARWTRVLVDGASMRGVHGENWTVLEGSANRTDMEGLHARCLHVRNSDWSNVNLRRAYLYRAMITGDPPLSMALRSADLSEAVLGQAYVAADLEGANLRKVSGAYVCLNNSRLSRTSLDSANLSHASVVKANFEGASLRGVEPPIFADRCPGLTAALDLSTPSGRRMHAFLQEIAVTLEKAPRGST